MLCCLVEQHCGWAKAPNSLVCVLTVASIPVKFLFPYPGNCWIARYRLVFPLLCITNSCFENQKANLVNCWMFSIDELSMTFSPYCGVLLIKQVTTCYKWCPTLWPTVFHNLKGNMVDCRIHCCAQSWDFLSGSSSWSNTQLFITILAVIEHAILYCSFARYHCGRAIVHRNLHREWTLIVHTLLCEKTTTFVQPHHSQNNVFANIIATKSYQCNNHHDQAKT